MDLKLKNFLQKHSGMEIYQKSLAVSADCVFAIGRLEKTDYLIVSGISSILDRFDGELEGDVKVCRLSHENRLAINQIFPFTCPRAAGRNVISMGLGDRLGLANYAHLLCVEDKNVFPIIAQQSKRELNLTKRTYEDVLDAAVWAVCKAGWRYGFGADGDHLETMKDIEYALLCGYSMITLDCSKVICSIPESSAALKATYEKIPAAERWRIEAVYLPYEDRYRLGISYTSESLMRIAVCYYRCVEFAEKVYKSEIVKAGRAVDFEISLDETEFATLPEAHFFVANELSSRDVVITSMAPRFVGEFQKAIDYIGDLDDFKRDFSRHCKIADYFGYKISIHSGSDKFSVFPIIGERAKERMHLKTAGTSWLEAVRVIAMVDPDLYRIMHKNALKYFDDARKYYVVHADISQVRPLEDTPDKLLPEYLNQNDARQLLHITYGYQLADPDIRKRFFDAMDRYYAEYVRTLTAHIGKHVALLNIAERNKS